MNISGYARRIFHPVKSGREFFAAERRDLPFPAAAPGSISPPSNPGLKADKIPYFQRFMGAVANQRLKIAFSIILADQISKQYVRDNLPFKINNSLIDNILYICPSFNYGGALGTKVGQSFLIASQLATISVAAIFYGIWSAKKYATDIYKIAKLSLALFAGASLSNLLERIQDGRVTDFIVVLPKLWPYIFNIADIGGLFSYLIGGYTILMAYRQDNEWVKSANRQ